MKAAICEKFQRPAASEGFTLVEAVVALLILAIIATASAAVLFGTLRLGVQSRQNQQAGDLLNQQLEYARSLPLGTLLTPTSDSNLTTGNLAPLLGSKDGTTGFYPVSLTSGTESLATGVSGAVPLKQTLTTNGTKYTYWTYVTCVSGTMCPGPVASAQRRVTVVVVWTAYGKTHTRSASTLITDAQSGLPLPYFRFAGPVDVTANANGLIVLPITLTNLGAKDAWTLAADNGPWNWYVDVDKNDALSAADTPMTVPGGYDSNGDGLLDTKVILPGQNLKMLATRSVTAADTGSVAVTLTATSVAQPAASTAKASVIDNVTFSSTTCASCYINRVYLHNDGSGADTNYINPMSMDSVAPTSSVMSSFSSSPYAGTPGRVLIAGGSGLTEPLGAKAAQWSRAIKTGCKVVAGTTAPSITLAIKSRSSLVTSAQLQAYLGSTTSKGVYSSISTATFSLSSLSSSSWTNFSLTLSAPVAQSLSKSSTISLRLVSNQDVILGYDSADYPSRLRVPLSSSACLS